MWNYLRTALSLLDRMVCAPVALPVSPFADATRVLRIWWRRAIRTTLKRSRGSLTLPDLSKCVDVQWTFVIRRSYLLRHACDQIPDACERRGGEAARGAGARALGPEARRRRAAHAALPSSAPAPTGGRASCCPSCRPSSGPALRGCGCAAELGAASRRRHCCATARQGAMHRVESHVIDQLASHVLTDLGQP